MPHEQSHGLLCGLMRTCLPALRALRSLDMSALLREAPLGRTQVGWGGVAGGGVAWGGVAWGGVAWGDLASQPPHGQHHAATLSCFHHYLALLLTCPR